MERKIMMAFLDGDYYTKHNSYPEEYSCDYAKESYVFNTPEDFINKWFESDEGIWYWVFVDDECICSGILDPDDIEIFEDYFGMTFYAE